MLLSMLFGLALGSGPQFQPPPPAKFEAETLTPEQEAERLKQLQARAKAGEPDACFFLGNFFWQGRLLPKDTKAALELWRTAAKKDQVAAMWNLGSRLQTGEEGVPKDLKEACMWLEKAAAKGHPKAVNRLAKLYEEGDGVPKDLAKAEAFYEQAITLQVKGAKESLARVRLAIAKGKLKSK